MRRLGVTALDNLHRFATGSFVPSIAPRLAYAEGGLVNPPAASGQGGGGSVRIVNAVAPELTHDHMQSPAGERVIVNVIGRNARSIRAALGV